MRSPDAVLVRYGEITLKDRWTRQSWERILAANIAFNLNRAGIEFKITRGEGRIFIHTSDIGASKIAAETFGVVSTSHAHTTAPEIAEVADVAVEIAKQFHPSSFAIRPRRSGGSISSEELGRAIGRAVRDSTGAIVDLKNPALEIFIEAREDKIYLFSNILKGVGGLPIGSQARMLALISGGLDSPVAAWMMMRRGCPVSLLHFDSAPYADSLVQSKRCAEVLSGWISGRKMRFIQVPIAKGIEKIAAHYPRATCVLCRRLMFRIAENIMEREGAYGIVTGYSLGQVASQTAENIRAEQAGIQAPIYHPLITMDKSEIMDLSRKIGTYRVSEETKSCTAVPSKPMTKAKLEMILILEEELGLKEMSRRLAEEMIVTKI